MPGLLPNTLSGFSATPSASRASTRGPFPKPFTDQRNEASSIHPSVAKAVRLSHFPALQAMGVQSRPLLPVTEAAKLGLCTDRRTTSMGRNMVPEDDSSGSEHDPSSVCLVAMVNEFMESESACATEHAASHNSAENATFTGLADISNSLESLACCQDDLEINLLRDVQAAIVESSDQDQHSGCACTDRKRMIMTTLQRRGYNAAICRTRWDHANGLSAGDYEFIDVLVASDSPAEPLRLLVDVEFQAQFEIARPLSEFLAILRLVPPIFVGRPERLQQIVRVLAEATKQSLCIKGMHLPPWRKLNYMLAKWFSAYKRTTNSLASRSMYSRKRPDDRRDFSGITARGTHNLMDVQCPNELEILYQGSKPPQEGSRDANSRPNIRDDLITVTMTSWQPPPLEAKSHSSTRMQSGAIGLTSMLLHTDIPIRNNVIANAA